MITPAKWPQHYPARPLSDHVTTQGARPSSAILEIFETRGVTSLIPLNFTSAGGRGWSPERFTLHPTHARENDPIIERKEEKGTLRHLVTTSKAPVTTSDALVPNTPSLRPASSSLPCALRHGRRPRRDEERWSARHGASESRWLKRETVIFLRRPGGVPKIPKKAAAISLLTR